MEGILSRRRRRSRRGTRASLPALVNPRARGNKLRGMKSLLYHAFGVKGFRCLRTRYEGGETIFEVERTGPILKISPTVSGLCILAALGRRALRAGQSN